VQITVVLTAGIAHTTFGVTLIYGRYLYSVDLCFYEKMEIWRGTDRDKSLEIPQPEPGGQMNNLYDEYKNSVYIKHLYGTLLFWFWPRVFNLWR